MTNSYEATEGGQVLALDPVGYVCNVGKFTVEVFQLIGHFLVPMAFFLQVVDEESIQNHEILAEVAFDKKVFVGGLDAWRGTHDIRDGGRRCNRECVC